MSDASLNYDPCGNVVGDTSGKSTLCPNSHFVPGDVLRIRRKWWISFSRRYCKGRARSAI